jgi:hypothetical protein
MWTRRGAVLAVCGAGLLAIAFAMRTPFRAESATTENAAGHRSPSESKPLHDDSRTVSEQQRADALARAHVWRAPQTPIARAALGRDLSVPPEIECRFKISDLGGTTPKFDCLLETGDEIRTKYGSAEIHAEAAATRLLAALGFGADTITLVERLRCYGCPKAPFVTTKIVEATRTGPLYENVVDAQSYEEFEWVALEERFAARPIESRDQKGWAFFELDAVDASKGGAPRTHVDALRLIAAFLAHWDNKSENQRLVCLSSDWPEGTRCEEPFLMLQDVGATFGPRKVDLESWETAMIWEQRATCTVSMRDLPYHGATFRSARVSESGRQFLLKLLDQLTDTQLTELFSGARFDKKGGLIAPARPVSDWVRVFRKRVETVREGPACPDV